MESARERFRAAGNTAMEASYLNRLIRWDPTSGMAELEADTRHVAVVLWELGLRCCKLPADTDFRLTEK